MIPWRKAAALIAATSMLGSCGAIRMELRQSGGYSGHLLDERLFDARRSKDLQLLRAAIVIALASRVGTAYVRNGIEADAFASYLLNATEELNALAAHVRNSANPDVPNTELEPCPTIRADRVPKTAPCPTYGAMFESELPALEYKIGKLVIAALPEREASDFISSVASGNYLSTAWKALWLGVKAMDGFHRGAATYRSTQEILAQAVLAGSDGQCTKDAGLALANIVTIEKAIDCLGLSNTEIFNNPREISKNDYPTKVPKEAFDALFEIVQTSCRLLPQRINTDETLLEQIRLRHNVCAGLKFEPKLRFGTIGKMKEVKLAPSPAPLVPPPPPGTSPSIPVNQLTSPPITDSNG